MCLLTTRISAARSESLCTRRDSDASAALGERTQVKKEINEDINASVWSPDHAVLQLKKLKMLFPDADCTSASKDALLYSCHQLPVPGQCPQGRATCAEAGAARLSSTASFYANLSWFQTRAGDR